MATHTKPLSDRHIVLCVGGGIAAYKSVFLLRLLVKAGAQVQVAMTPSATSFVGPLTFQTLSGRPVFTNMFDNQQDAEIGHIRIADGADLLIVAPATGNLMARLRAGMANDPVAAAVLATRSPVLLAPAMNVNMWNSAATRSNVEILQQRGMHFVGPDDGFLACQWTGSGRLAEPPLIVEAAEQVLSSKDLHGQRILVTAGGTREALDPVRFLGNRSSGKMGFALARAARLRGAHVHLIAGITSAEAPAVAAHTRVESAEQMANAVMSARDEADIIIMAAAVADYRPADVASDKLKKEAMGAAPSLALVGTTDILARLGRERGGSKPFLVGFAAESQALAANAEAKRVAKGCDMIVANDISRGDRGFGSADNAVEIHSAQGTVSLGLASKDEIAHSILDVIRKQVKIVDAGGPHE